ncbi:unnamed protein product [Caenorhabditis sp. 36 PRJEB53466]|nr:unnamed protein product [Caenorhabditis sp. 36 PRJEB53466]
MRLLLLLFLCLFVIRQCTAKGKPEVSHVEWSPLSIKHYYYMMETFYTSQCPYFDTKTNALMSLDVMRTANVFSKEKYVIVNESEPMILATKKHKYYWDGRNGDLQESSIICEYRITERDLNFLKQTVFKNGTHPSVLFYGCSFANSCEGLQCSPPNYLFWSVIGIVVLCFTAITLAFWFAYKKQEQARKIELKNRLERFQQQPLLPGQNVVYVVQGRHVNAISVPAKR